MKAKKIEPIDIKKYGRIEYLAGMEAFTAESFLIDFAKKINQLIEEIEKLKKKKVYCNCYKCGEEV